jgi:hypothetical protein
MIAPMSQPGSRRAWVALAAWWSLLCITSCLSGDEAPAGGRVEHPQRAPMPVLSAQQAQDGGPSGEKFSPLDHTIANDCSSGARPWSKNVPARDCTADAECGDGFCDRGRCAPIWTCRERYGQRCLDVRSVASARHKDDTCNGLCLDGRCRSCQSDAECREAYSNDYICGAVEPWHRGRGCMPRPLPPSEAFERFAGRKISPADKAILDDCPTRAWSKHVPNRRCTKDDECGDGFCDRGRCAAIWTCAVGCGERCESDRHCDLFRACLDGRCRSCAATEECDRTQGPHDSECTADPKIPGARECRGTLGSRMGMVTPPDQSCRKDSECGVGFCDRGRCVAATDPYGTECHPDRGDRLLDRYLVGFLVCRDGRWRSCESDAECARLGAATCRPRPRSQVYGCSHTPRPPSSAPLPQPVLTPSTL